MIARLFASTLLILGLSQVAAAQSNQQDQPSSSPQNMQAAAPDVPQTLRERLTSAGYSDVRILPNSLVITAIDKGGRPVLMRLTPRSMFFLIPAASPSTTGMASGSLNDRVGLNQPSASADEAQTSAPGAPPSMTTGAAMADSNDNVQQNQSSNSAENTPSSRRDVPPSLRDRLTSAGFTNVNIVPRSLMITAMDRNDRPVMMRITPTSIFFVTEIPAAGSSTTGAANSSGDYDQSR